MPNSHNSPERLRRILSKHGKALRRTADVLAGDEERGEELMQVIMAWALSTEVPVTRSRICDYLRRISEARYFKGYDHQAHPVDDLPNGDQPIEDAHVREEVLGEIGQAYETLDPYERGLIREILFNGRDSRELALERRVSDRTLRWQYREAMQKLRKQFDRDDLRKALALPILSLAPAPRGKAWTFSKRLAVVATAAMVFCAAIVSLALLIGGPDLDSLSASGENNQQVARPLAGVEPSQAKEARDSIDGELQSPEKASGLPAKTLVSTNIQSSAAGKAPRPNRVEPETWRDQVSHPDQEWVQEFRSDGTLQREYQIVPWMPKGKRLWGESRYYDGDSSFAKVQFFMRGKPHGPLYRFVGGERKMIAFYQRGERLERR